jgi:formylglycine-generating enzyme required for sulfatase activity
VWEWCLDPQDQPFRVARGGAWNSWIDINLRQNFRWYGEPTARNNATGFRCLLVKTGSN